MNPHPCEGDFVLTSEHIIFDVKGMSHPPDRIISYVRYIPHPEGNRCRDDTRYRKIYNLKDRFNFLKKKFPHYLYFDPVFHQLMQAVPYTHVAKIFNPIERLRELYDADQRDPLEERAVGLASILTIPHPYLGISGSVLVGLHTPSSDIDLIVYGKEQGKKAYAHLKTMRDQKRTFAFDSAQAAEKALFRWGSTRSDLARIEQKKVLHGMYCSSEYFIRLLDLSSEPYGEIQYIPQYEATLTGWITDDTESIFTPCRYELSDSSLSHVTTLFSLRGRYCEQVHAGEKIMAHGMVEKVCTPSDEFYQLSLQDPSHFLYPVQCF
ncbi:MAG: hypothetical protein HXS47_14265 [Theionarchaea archaeon]|nr:hypothetical protein [Theionarchaea archaeon]